MPAVAKGFLLNLLERLNLLVPTFRAWELTKTLGAKSTLHGPDGLPLPSPTLMVRVAGTPDVDWFLEGGRLAAESISAALERAGVEKSSLNAIYDFGCGCGRVLRHWNNLDARICGSDLNAQAIKWVQDNLPFTEVSVNQLEPPLAHNDSSFDLVYALSVFTHIEVGTQIAWRDELTRILRPGGLLLLTVHGDAYIERMSSEEQQTYRAGHCVVRWAGAAGSNLCSTFHPFSFVRDQLAQGLEMLDYVPRGALGNPEQDLVLLRKPA